MKKDYNISNFNIGDYTDLLSRFWLVLKALIVFRIGSYIPIPGINAEVLTNLATQHAEGILGMFNLLSGGSLSRMSIFALSLMPYITASIMVQLMSYTLPYLIELRKEGGVGRKKMNQISRILTFALSLVQGFGMAMALESMADSGQSLVAMPGWIFRITAMASWSTSTMFLMWLGDYVSDKGIGNGISLIIFAGIVAGLPKAIVSMFSLSRSGLLPYSTVMVVMLMVAVMVFVVVLVESSFRKIVVQYPKRQVGQAMYGGDVSHLPIKLNTAGVIPAIFSSSILLFPTTIAQFYARSLDNDSWLEAFVRNFSHGQLYYILAYAFLVIFFCFFYTNIVFNVDETATNLKKQGGIILGYRPGKKTAEYLQYVLTRVTVFGALYMSFICIVPEILISSYSLPFYLGGTSILIVVNVILDLINQSQSHLFSSKYKALLSRSKLLGSVKQKTNRRGR